MSFILLYIIIIIIFLWLASLLPDTQRNCRNSDVPVVKFFL